MRQVHARHARHASTTTSDEQTGPRTRACNPGTPQLVLDAGPSLLYCCAGRQDYPRPGLVPGEVRRKTSPSQLAVRIEVTLRALVLQGNVPGLMVSSSIWLAERWPVPENEKCKTSPSQLAVRIEVTLRALVLQGSVPGLMASSSRASGALTAGLRLIIIIMSRARPRPASWPGAVSSCCTCLCCTATQRQV